MKTIRLSSLLHSIALLAACLAIMACSSPSRAQTYPPAFSTSASYAIGDQVQLNGNVLRATHAVTPGGFKYDDWELWEVRANTVLVVGVSQTFTTLPLAWAYVKNARIADGAYLHVYISTAHGIFNESFNAPFSLDQGSGADITLTGDTKANINLTFTNSNGLVVDSGHSFGTISNITITGENSYTGITATTGGAIADISNVESSQFGVSVYAFQSGNVHVENTFSATTSGTVFAAGMDGSIVVANGLTINGTGAGTCFYANHNGSIIAESCTVGTGTGTAGFAQGVWAENGGFIDVNSGSINDCTLGCEADFGGRITIRSGSLGRTVHSNGEDMKVFDGGTIDATSAVGNGSNFVGSNDGSYIWTNSG